MNMRQTNPWPMGGQQESAPNPRWPADQARASAMQASPRVVGQANNQWLHARRGPRQTLGIAGFAYTKHGMSKVIPEGILARNTMTRSSQPPTRLLDDLNLRRLFRMVLGHRKVLNLRPAGHRRGCGHRSNPRKAYRRADRPRPIRSRLEHVMLAAARIRGACSSCVGSHLLQFVSAESYFAVGADGPAHDDV